MKEKLKKLLKMETLIIFVFVVLVIAIIAIIFLDRDKMTEVLRQSNLTLLIWATLATVAAYISMTIAFVLCNKLFKIPVGTKHIFIVGFITIAIGNLLDWGGLGGYSLRVALLKQKCARISSVMASSLFHAYIAFSTLLTILPFGCIWLFITGRFHFPRHLPLVYIMAFTTTMVVIVTVLFFSINIRHKIEAFANKVVKKLTKKDYSQRFTSFNSAIDVGIQNIKNNPKVLLGILAAVLGNWTFSIIAIGFCFKALGLVVTPAVLTAGFGVGVTTAYFAVIPGGLGIQDGSMAGIYSLFDVPLRISLYASILFRIVYYFLPAILGLTFYAVFLKASLGKKAEEEAFKIL